MKPLLAVISRQLARNPQLLDRLGRFGEARQQSWQPTSAGGGPTIEHVGSWQTGNNQRGRPGRSYARTLVWTVGGGVLLFWILLVAGAVALWPAIGEGAITGVTSVGRTTGLPIDLAEPIASALYLAKDIGGPALTVLGVVVSVVILGVTALAARVLGGPGRRSLPR